MQTSYNGWTASPNREDIGVVPLVVAGVSFPGGVRGGHVETVLRYVAEQFNYRVEPLVDGWCWGYAYRQNRNADNLSCHASATAIDLNAPRHPNGKRGTFGVKQVAEIRKILAEVGPGVLRWGGDFTGTPDEMHVEVVGSPRELAEAGARLTGKTPPAPMVRIDMAKLDLPVLEHGATGEHVQTLQGLLGARSQPVDIDGDFGDATRAGVKAFQTWARLDADGIVGELTWHALIAREKAAA